MIDVEAYIVFLAACFFTVLYVSSDDMDWLGIFASVAWIVLGFLWLPLAFEAPSYNTFAVALLFNGFGIMLIVIIMIQRLNFGRKKYARDLGED